MNEHILLAFQDELIKLSAASPQSPSGAGKYAPLLYMGAGAAGLLGAQSAYRDWKSGRQMRKLQQQQQRGGY